MKKVDIIIGTIIIIIAVGILGVGSYRSNVIKQNSNQLYVDIYVEGTLYKSVPLYNNEDTIEIETEHGRNVVKVHDDGVEMTEADCFDSICVKSGFKKNVGEIIVCLPHKVVVEISGDSE